MSSKLENKRCNYIVSLVNRNDNNLSVMWVWSWFRTMGSLAEGLPAIRDVALVHTCIRFHIPKARGLCGSTQLTISHVFLIHSSVSRRVDYFCMLALVKNSVINMGVLISLRDPDFSYFGWIPRRGVAGTRQFCVDFVEDSAYCFPQRLNHFTFSPSVKGFNFRDDTTVPGGGVVISVVKMKQSRNNPLKPLTFPEVSIWK